MLVFVGLPCIFRLQNMPVNTIKGLLRYERLPNGIASARVIVQWDLEDILHGLTALVHFDYVFVAPSNIDLHIATPRELFESLREFNVELMM